MDINGNGHASLAEVDKALRDVLQIEDIFDCKPAIMRAFQAAKKVVKTKNPYGDDYIQFREFRILLYFLRQYFEFYQAFDRVDQDDDRRIDRDEFIQSLPQLEMWVGKIDDPDAEFDSIDTNGGGIILFDEFCEWAWRKELDLEDDDDAQDN